MTRGSRIVAIDASAEQAAAIEPPASLETPLELEEVWEDAAPALARPWRLIAAACLAVGAVIGWTVLFVMVNLEAMAAGGSPAQWAAWIGDYCGPVLLVGVAWLLAMRSSRREALRFGETARLLSDESTRLETRLITVNQELSLAREFISAQARDLEALGRIAAERLGENADRLADLVRDNGLRIDAIGDVSSAALENMEKLRGQLPVIANSAKDVTNNIAAAGRTAHGQLEDMIAGFNKLNDFGQASERQVLSLKALVENTLSEFIRQTDQLDTITGQRFAALGQQSEEFRTRLDGHEVEALAAVRSRASAMATELERARELLDTQEAESLTSLRARLSAVRDEGAVIGRSLREAEATALESWREAIVRLEEQLREAIAKIADVDAKALETARSRLSELAREAEDADARMAERDRLFAEEIERRRDEIAAQGEAFSERLNAQLAQLDAAIAERRAEQDNHGRKMAEHGEAIAAQLGDFAARMGEAADHARDVEQGTASSLARLTENLTLSRAALAGTDTAVKQLTDNSVRLLELIQASVQHSSNDLPQAMQHSEARLREIEERAAALKSLLVEAEGQGSALTGHIQQGQAMLAGALGEIEMLHGRIGGHVSEHGEELTRLSRSLEQIRSESEALSGHAQGELKVSIEALNAAASSAVAEIGEMSAASIKSLAERLGEDSAQAIEQAMRSRAAEVAGQLELAAEQAAGVSREAAIQLRDQLAKVNELAGHLERRVAHARSRAEEQVDNDFARRVALITESLNSNAIDIARAMDVDVSDSAWAAYLRGDRGVFTRRAVKLLDTPEAKSVTRLYEHDHDFREHVSRYIHDFEAMLRQLLSTRDGHALGVTLLSSDMGKLYVALAQAIERLRK